MRIKPNVNSADTWSYVHFLGSGFLIFVLREVGICISLATIITLLGGLLWELLDEIWLKMYEPDKFWDKIFDWRGFSWLDLVFDTGGVALSVGIILL